MEGSIKRMYLPPPEIETTINTCNKLEMIDENFQIFIEFVSPIWSDSDPSPLVSTARLAWRSRWMLCHD